MQMNANRRQPARSGEVAEGEFVFAEGCQGLCRQHSMDNPPLRFCQTSCNIFILNVIPHPSAARKRASVFDLTILRYVNTDWVCLLTLPGGPSIYCPCLFFFVLYFIILFLPGVTEHFRHHCKKKKKHKHTTNKNKKNTGNANALTVARRTALDVAD